MSAKRVAAPPYHASLLAQPRAILSACFFSNNLLL